MNNTQTITEYYALWDLMGHDENAWDAGDRAIASPIVGEFIRLKLSWAEMAQLESVWDAGDFAAFNALAASI